MTKLERQYNKAWQAVDDVLNKADGDVIWANEDFWVRRWPAMIDRAAELTELLAQANRAG